HATNGFTVVDFLCTINLPVNLMTLGSNLGYNMGITLNPVGYLVRSNQLNPQIGRYLPQVHPHYRATLTDW
ncbi:MAG: hypothetical protein KDI02_26065, partial [Anaerolineae bacterium]|nr:hypothetical protein [Anaerolineae bacterium]